MTMKHFHSLLAIVACFLLAAGQAQAVPLTIKVLSPDGAPVPQARLWVWPAANAESVTVNAPLKPRELQTDAQGVVALDLDKPVETSSRVAGSTYFGTVTGFAPTFAPAQTALQAGENILKMERAAVVRGVVRDGEGRPVADAPVRIQTFQLAATPGQDSRIGGYVAVPEQLQELTVARSDAQGRWKITLPPLGAQANLMLDDVRFARAFVSAFVSAEAVEEQNGDATGTILTARPAATISGRIVYEDGRPAEGVKVEAGSESRSGIPARNEAVSDAQGNYRLQSLARGSVRVRILNQPLQNEWVAALSAPIILSEGQSATAPDIVLGKGGLLEGRIVDAATGAGVAGAQLWLSGGGTQLWSGNQIIRSDKAGKFSTRVVPGENRLALWDQPRGYLAPEKGSFQEPLIVTAVKGETKTVEIKLAKGIALKGTGVDEAGRPATGAQLTWRMEKAEPFPSNGNSATTIVGKDGAWDVSALKPGRWKLSSSGAWDVQNPKVIEVGPATDAIKVLLKAVKLQSATGRVLSSDGQPVKGARVTASITETRDNMGYGSQRAAVTDAEGRWTIPLLRPEVSQFKIVVTKPGHRFMRGGETTRQDETWKATDAVLNLLNARVTGRVLNLKGEPLEGAKVLSADGEAGSVVSTDAQGRFTLTGLPAGQVAVVAVHRDGALSQRLKTNGDEAELRLQPATLALPRDEERAREILDDAWQTSRGRQNYYNRQNLPAELAPFDPDGALELGRGGSAAAADQVVANIILALARADAKRAVAWAPAKLALITDSGTRTPTALRLGRLVREVDEPLARKLYAQGSADVETIKESYRKNQVLQLLAQLGSELKDAGAEKWFELALEAARTKTEGMTQLGTVAEAMAEVNTDWAERALDEFEKASTNRPTYMAGPEYYQGRIIGKVARRNPGAARKLLERYDKGTSQRNSFQFVPARTAIMRSLGKQNRDEALLLARGIAEQMRPAALALAAKYFERDEALKLLREAVQSAGPYVSVATLSDIAAQAFDLDAATGRELFTLVYGRVPDLQRERQSYARGIAAFAYNYRRIDPLESRLLLEAEWARQFSVPATEQDEWMHATQFPSIVLTMASLDIERAVEMAMQIPLDMAQGVAFETQRQLARFLLADEATRQSAPLTRWTTSLIEEERNGLD